MRIISQDGRTDIPYENFVFGITKDNSIVAIRDTIARPSEIAHGVVATYSTEEKAIKATEMLRKVYENNVFYHCTAGSKRFEEVQCILSEEQFRKVTTEYFQFPQDDEIEV